MESTWKWKLAQNLEYRWWRRYLSGKDPLAYLQWKCSYWDNFLLDLSKYVESPEGLSILDSGCGPAGIFMVLKGNHVTAMDPLLGQYRQLPVFQPEHYPWVRFREQALEALEDQEQYDIIFCLNAINHVHDIGRCYDNLVRALKPGGYMLISTDAHRFSWLKSIFRSIPGDMLHPQQYGLDDYEKFITDRGCSVTASVLLKREAIFDYYVTIARKP